MDRIYQFDDIIYKERAREREKKVALLAEIQCVKEKKVVYCSCMVLPLYEHDGVHYDNNDDDHKNV